MTTRVKAAVKRSYDAPSRPSRRRTRHRRPESTIVSSFSHDENDRVPFATYVNGSPDGDPRNKCPSRPRTLLPSPRPIPPPAPPRRSAVSTSSFRRLAKNSHLSRQARACSRTTQREFYYYYFFLSFRSNRIPPSLSSSDRPRVCPSKITFSPSTAAGIVVFVLRFFLCRFSICLGVEYCPFLDRNLARPVGGVRVERERVVLSVGGSAAPSRPAEGGGTVRPLKIRWTTVEMTLEPFALRVADYVPARRLLYTRPPRVT